MKRFLVAASFAVLTCSAFALPTIGEVQSEIGKGHYARAEEMTREVVTARPGSARARYVHAEILAHNQRFAQAAEEAAQARRLDPGLSFTDPEKIRNFTQLLARQQSQGTVSSTLSPAAAAAYKPSQSAGAAPANHGGGLPTWAWAGVAGLLAMLAWRALGARPQARPQWPPAMPAAAGPLPTGGAAGGTGFSGYAPAPAAPAAAPAGNGLWGTGMAVAGGVAAGMLAEKWFEGQRESGGAAALLPAYRASEPGGVDDRSARDVAAQELEQRSIDMGNGDDWGGNDRDASSADGW